jgi:SAM-dependent methyltransferase
MTQDGRTGEIAVQTWPARRESLALVLVAAATGDRALPPAPAGAPPREIVEYEDFPTGVIDRFEAAVAAGSVADSAAGFARFASEDFATFRSFRARHPDTAAASEGIRRIVLSRAALRADPGAALPRLLAFLGHDIDPARDGAALERMAERAEARLAALPAPDPAAFRHHDPALFDTLGRLSLPRSAVLQVFTELMGRAPNEAGILRMQTQATPALLRRSLGSSDEYRRRQGAAPAPAEAPTEAAQPDRFEGFSRIFDRPPAALAPLPPTAARRPALQEAARQAATAVTAAQDTYQPLYGLGPAGESRREELLRASCALVAAEFVTVARKAQPRILDVGSNAGFVSFVLAETFPNTVGFDVNTDNVALARALKAHSGSPALFFETDLLALADSPEPDFESLDCVLFLNVIHQLIFARGLPYVKALLGRLSQTVDLIVVELARPAEYVRFGKDALLPLDPAEILEDCRDATITLIKDGKRPVYTIRRRSLTLGRGDGAQVLPYSTVRFSDHPDARVNRKYYFGSDSVTKVMRYSALQTAAKFRAERDGLLALQGLGVAPRLLAWDESATMGRIAMQRLYGPPLNQAVRTAAAADRPRLLAEVLRIAAVLAQKGLCQNDFSAHNFILLTDGSLRMIDFELTAPIFRRDPFASLLWIAHDILSAAPESYRHVDAARLLLGQGPDGQAQVRVGRDAYPPADPAAARTAFGPVLAEILDEAAATPAPWADFVAAAWARLAPTHGIPAHWPAPDRIPDPVPGKAPAAPASRSFRLSSLFNGARK